MSKGLLSVATVLTAGSIIFVWKKYLSSKQQLIDRQTIKKILIALRKRFFSTLRQIAYVVQNLKAHEGMTTKKIAEIIMRSGSSAEMKLNTIQETVLFDHNIQKRDSFEYSCNYYKNSDIQIKILLESLKMDIEMALQGSNLHYNGPLPDLNSDTVFELYQEVIHRRVSMIEKSLGQTEQISEQEKKKNFQSLIRNQEQIADYLQMKGIFDEKEPSEKLLLALVQRNCLQSAYFQLRMQEFQNHLQYAIKKGQMSEYWMNK